MPVLVIAFAVANERWPRLPSRRLALAAATVFGLLVNLLGVLFYYGATQSAAREASENLLATLQGDPRWNPIVFDARLLWALIRQWWSPVPIDPQWVPQQIWIWEGPATPTSATSIHLLAHARLLPSLLVEHGARIWWLYASAAVVGPALLVRCWAVSRGGPRPLRRDRSA